MRSGKIGGFLAAAMMVLSTPAAAWDLDKMNRTINQTNFILDDQCSATLVSLRLKAVLTNAHCVDRKVAVVERDETQPDGTVKKVKREKRDDVTLAQRSYVGAERVGAAEYQAEIVAYQKNRDRAVLKIKGEIPHAVESQLLPDGREVLRGQRIYIVGNPRMLDASVVEGIVSSVTRTFEVPWANDEKIQFYQVSGGVTYGNSGGALYDDEGYFIGVPAAGFSEKHLGLVITLPTIKRFLKDNCYAAVWDRAAPTPEACFEEKRAAMKKAPAKSGE